jgi:putative oxidoreductase
MSQVVETNPKLFIPALGRLYAPLGDVADVLLRVLIGGLFIPHGYAKLFVETDKFIAFFGRLGFGSPVFMTYFIGSLEFFGAIAIVLGLLTRPLAFMLFINMVVAAAMVHLPKGWSASTGGAEYVVALAGIAAILAIRGGGRWSLDRALFGREI